jgi:hypothetical protein
VSLPPDSASIVAASLARTAPLRRGPITTIVTRPTRRVVAAAIASVIIGS